MTISESRGSATSSPQPSLVHPLPCQSLAVVDSATGIYSHLRNGEAIIDACAVSIINHGDETVKFAVQKQMAKVSYAHSIMHKTAIAEDLAAFLLDSSPLGPARAYFVSSGSEAVESAMKLAVSFHRANGQPDRTHFVSRQQSYHGNTIGAMGLSSHCGRKAPYEAAFNRLDVSFVSATNAYRDQTGDENEIQYASRLVDEVEAEFVRVGPKNVAAFVAETVGGSTAGCLLAPTTYFEGIRRVCDRHGVLLILDEVMCGNGRTGTYFAFESEGEVVPDIVTMGKGLAGGYLPIGGLLVRDSIYQRVQGSGGFVNGHTYQAHPVSCAAALAVQTIVRQPACLSHCRRLGMIMGSRLHRLLGDKKYVGDIRGRGLFWAVEFVADRQSKRPLDQAFRFAAKVRQCAHDSGAAILSGSGTVDGQSGDHIMLAPPLTITEEELEHLLRIVASAYVAVEGTYISLWST